MRALGLDPSLKAYGWCVFDSKSKNSFEKLISSGHEGTLNTMVPVARYIHFRALVTELLRRFKIDVIGIESPAYDGGPFSERHFGLMLYSLEAAFEARKDCVLFDPVTLKALATGKSNAEKADMQRFVQLDRLSTDVVQSDEADAYCLARFACRFWELRSGVLKPEDLSENEKKYFLERTKKKSNLIKRTAHLFKENSRFFEFSKIPEGEINLPDKSKIREDLLDWLEK